MDIKAWEEMIHPDDRGIALSLLEEALREAAPYHVTYRFRRKDGTYVDIEDTGAFLKNDQWKAYRMLGSMKDITERRKAETKIRESEEKYRSYFENDLAGSYMSTVDGKILACNPAFARIFGFDTVEAVLKTGAVDLYITPGHRKDFLRLLQKNRRLENHEEEMKRRDGQQIRIVENVVGKFDENGNLVEIQGYIFDVTNLQKL